MTNDPRPVVNWRRGLHRVFALLCVLWTLWVFVGWPLVICNRQREFWNATWFSYVDRAEARMKECVLRGDGAGEEEIRKEMRSEQEKVWKRLSEASLADYYRRMTLSEFSWVLCFAVLVPAVFYGLIRGSAALVIWLYRGFKLPPSAA